MSTITTAYDARVADGRLKADPAQRGVLPELDRLADALRQPEPRKRGLSSLFSRETVEAPKGLYIWGGVGRGKSMLMDLFHATLDIGEKRRVHFHAFMQEVQTALHEVRKTGVDNAIKPVADDIAEGVRILCLDEMQITDIADAMIVGRLFERLFEKGVTVITTSNRPPRDLYKDGLNRALFLPFIDLIEERMVVHELASPRDYRQDVLKGADTYFTPADAEARASVDAIWQELTDGESETLTLTVKGRAVVLSAFARGAARAKFLDLCGQPFGPADYLAIAEAVRVLVLEDIPVLSSENYNQARRFVTLIDALYEAKVRLIATAATTPENLYLEGEGSFEFERTASRLREMQADDWGAR